MTSSLPSAIQNYFSGKNARDFAAAASGFAASAIVKDEGHDYMGPDAIRAWMETTAAEYDDKAQIKSAISNENNVEVAAEVSGTFPGSPALLRFSFTLDKELISRLEIAP